MNLSEFNAPEENANEHLSACNYNVKCERFHQKIFSNYYRMSLSFRFDKPVSTEYELRREDISLIIDMFYGCNYITEIIHEKFHYALVQRKLKHFPCALL